MCIIFVLFSEITNSISTIDCNLASHPGCSHLFSTLKCNEDHKYEYEYEKADLMRVCYFCIFEKLVFTVHSVSTLAGNTRK